MSLTLSELRRRYLEQGRPVPRAVRLALQHDPRAGAAALLDALERRSQAAIRESRRLRRLSRFEQVLWKSGVQHIAGVDEAGMSPLAGPVVAGAVVLPVGYRRAGIDDSKKLSAAQREELATHLKREALAWAIGIATPDEIDRINIYHAGLLAMRRAVEALALRPEHLLIDARSLRQLEIPQQGIVRGDAQSISIASASILAKTSRDAMMLELDRRYPGYGFARHKGYPVREHVRAMTERGVLPVHRRSFAPVQQALGLRPVQLELG
ncbi:MAG: ribonuclease HII [Polyangiales bacterium]